MTKYSLLLGAAVLPFAAVAPVLAGSHTWDIVEVFSNGDGTIQFIELKECCGNANETGLLNKTVTSTTTGLVFTFPANLPGGSTANAHILLGTTAFAALPGAPTPDHIIPSNFFSTTAEPFPGIEYWVYDDFIFSVGVLPTNGKDALARPGPCPQPPTVCSGVVAMPNSPTNFSGHSGNVDACPWDLDLDGEVGIVDFLELLANWNNPYDIVDFLALLAAWGSC